MNARLAGHNILIVEPSKVSATLISQALGRLGANVFTASEIAQALVLQRRWDIDIVLCEASVLSGGGEVVVCPQRTHGKPAALLFAHGPAGACRPEKLAPKGVLRFFPTPLNFSEMVEEISAFLFDPAKHLRDLSAASEPQKFGFILQNASGLREVEVFEFLEDGFVGLSAGPLAGETATMTVLVPGLPPARFSVRLEPKEEGCDTWRVKLLWRDRVRWEHLLGLLDSKQQQIFDFLKASSGK